MFPTSTSPWQRLWQLAVTVGVIGISILILIAFFYIAFWGVVLGAILGVAFYVKNRWFADSDLKAFHHQAWRRRANQQVNNNDHKASGNVYEHDEPR